MDQRIQDLKAEMLDGSTTFHLGERGGPSLLLRFLNPRALWLAAAVAAAAPAGAAAGAADGPRPQTETAQRLQRGFGAGVGGLLAASRAGQPVDRAAALRARAAEGFVGALNARMDAKVALVAMLLDGNGDEVGRFRVGDDAPDATVCTTSAPGRGTIYNWHSDREFDWVADPDGAAATFQAQIAADVYECLADAGAVRHDGDLSEFDEHVAVTKSDAGHAILYTIGAGGTDAIAAHRAMLEDLAATDHAALRGAAALGEVLRRGADGLSGVRSYADLSAAAGDIAAGVSGFSRLGGDDWRAPDGTVVSADPADPRFGWEQVDDGTTDEPIYERLFGDPVLEHMRREEYDAAAALAERQAASERARIDEFARDGVLYRGSDALGRDCREFEAEPADGAAGSTAVAAACQNDDGTWSVVPSDAFERDGAAGQPQRMPRDWISPDGRYRSAERARNGWIVRGDVGMDADHVLVKADGTNIFRDSGMHNIAMVGGPKSLNIRFGADGRPIDLESGFATGRMAF